YPRLTDRREPQRQAVARVETDMQIRTVDDRKTETAGRHRVGFERFVVPECDLDAGDLRILIDQLLDPAAIDFVAHAMRAKQDDAVTGALLHFLEAPDRLAVEREDGFDLFYTIELRTLFGALDWSLDAIVVAT